MKKPVVRRGIISARRDNCKKALISTSLFGVFLILAASAILPKIDWQMTADEIKASNYMHSEETEQIANTLKLTRRGRVVFFAANPQLRDSRSFNRACDNDDKNSYTLGCYHGNEDEHIDVFDTGNSVINELGYTYDFGASRNITALHEMLHAVYARLDEDTRVKTCSNTRIIAADNSELTNSLANYRDDEYCTEAFARIGSEYIIPLMRDVEDSAQKTAVSEMSALYQKYFSYNYDLFEAYEKNQNTERALREYLAVESDNLASKKSDVQSMKDDYHRAPTWAKYYKANAAIDDYNSNLAKYREYDDLYQKIMRTLDSESSMYLAEI